MNIVHVETGRHLYGGGQQVLWLLDGLNRRGVQNLLVCAEDSALADAADDAGIDVLSLDCRGDLDLRFARRLRSLIDARKPDLVHSHSRRGADTFGGRAARLPLCRAAWTIANRAGWRAGVSSRTAR